MSCYKANYFDCINCIDGAHGIGDTALIHFKISMRLFIQVRPIIYQKLQNFANINNLMLKIQMNFGIILRKNC